MPSIADCQSLIAWKFSGAHCAIAVQDLRASPADSDAANWPIWILRICGNIFALRFLRTSAEDGCLPDLKLTAIACVPTTSRRSPKRISTPVAMIPDGTCAMRCFEVVILQYISFCNLLTRMPIEGDGAVHKVQAY